MEFLLIPTILIIAFIGFISLRPGTAAPAAPESTQVVPPAAVRYQIDAFGTQEAIDAGTSGMGSIDHPFYSDVYSHNDGAWA